MNAVTQLAPSPTQSIDSVCQHLQELLAQVETQIFGQKQVVTQAMLAILAGGHILLEGVPGLGKTRLVRSFAQAMDLSFARIQFTPDLMPADITGTHVLSERQVGDAVRRQLEFQQGPVFANLVLADEINRATPKTQAALLEAMAEHQVTTSGGTLQLPRPFFVLATQNPLEQEGTYPLPEAQLDRFLFKILVEAPSEDTLLEILQQTGAQDREMQQPVWHAENLLAAQSLLNQMPATPSLMRYIAKLLRATHPNDPGAPASIARFVRCGASPRGAQAMLQAARANALMQGRLSPTTSDVLAVVKPALRHRLLLTFEGQAQEVSSDSLLDDVLAAVPKIGAASSN